MLIFFTEKQGNQIQMFNHNVIKQLNKIMFTLLLMINNNVNSNNMLMLLLEEEQKNTEAETCDCVGPLR